MRNSGRAYRSLFWPVVMIGVGVVWLLANFGLIPAVSLNWLASMWPLLLIAIGLDMLIGRGSPVLGAIIALLLVGGVLALAVAGPALGVRLPTGADVRVERFDAPLDGATAASVVIESSAAPVQIHSAAGEDMLFESEIGYTGEIDFRVSGDTEKQVSLSRRGNVGFDIGLLGDARLKWDIGLAPSVPLNLEVDSASGSVALNLEDLRLADLKLDSGSGSVTLVLPQTEQPYAVEIESGSGAVAVTLPSRTTLTLRVNSGSGSVSLTLPANAAVRLEVPDSGSGGVNVPARMERVFRGDDDDEGVWETPDFGNATQRITIIASTGSGSLRLR